VFGIAHQGDELRNFSIAALTMHRCIF